MGSVIKILIYELLSSGIEFINIMLNLLMPMVLNAEEFMFSVSGNNWFDAVYDVFFQFGISMIVLKFLFKGFSTYMLWTDGDPDADPMGLLTNFLRALTIAICFPILYTLMADVTEDLINMTMDAIGLGTEMDVESFISVLPTVGLTASIIVLVFFIMLFILFIRFFARGLELVILRIGMPFACVGLIDNDKGVFAPYIKKIFQSLLTLIVQITFTKLSISMMINNHLFWGIACLSVALKIPQTLNEFMLASGGGGGNFMSKAFYTSNMIKSIRSIFPK